MIVDGEGKEFWRTEGYLPPHDLLAQLMVGLGRALFLRNKPADAQKLFREVADNFTDTDFAAEAEYWAGVAGYRATADHQILEQTGKVVTTKYPGTSWAKRASVWV